jgi:hypothetical protein
MIMPPAEVRFIVYRGTQPLCAYHTLPEVVAFLWGKCLGEGYLVLDYERPYEVDQPDLTAWAAHHWPEEAL